MRRSSNLAFIGYLVCGVLYALFLGGSLNPLNWAVWLNIILWLPLLIWFFFWKIIAYMLCALLLGVVIFSFMPRARAALYRGLHQFHF